MNIIFCAAEAAPFAKVGGLGDVVGSLPKALTHQGLKPVLVLPRYGFLDPHELGLEKLPLQLTVALFNKPHEVGVWQGRLPDSSIQVYFLESAKYFASRQVVYPPDYSQEVEGFLLFSKALFELLVQLNLQADILHLHDWHTAPAAVELVEQRRQNAFFQNTRSMLTIHNMAYQGHYQGTNWLAEGLRHADFITAVSPSYAQEIQTSEFGAGLEGIVQARATTVQGILNGIDTGFYNPATDVFLPQTYDHNTVHEGKALCKQVLQQELGLSIRSDLPLVGMITRLVEQKGLDILLPALETLLQRPAQWVILGSGEAGYETILRELNPRYTNFRSYLGFNVALAQKIYAGSDIFLMPSRFEPCGLGQMIALRYGSVPVVRATGGLIDTVFDAETDKANANGFCFSAYDSTAMAQSLDRALQTYPDKQRWYPLMENAMSADFSWTQSARQYEAVYSRMLAAPPQVA